MVKSALKIIGGKISSLHMAAYLLGAFSLFSQVLALVRDRLLAHIFGAGIELDIYYASFRIPDFIFITAASVVSLSVLIPVFTKLKEENREKAKEFLDSVFSIFFLIIIAVGIVALIFMPQILKVAFPGFSGENFETLTLLSRILLLSPLLLGLSNLFSSVIQVHKRFILYALSPVVYNVGIIIGILFLLPLFGMVGLVYGVALGAVFHLGMQIPFVYKKGFLPKFRKPATNLIKSVFTLSLPRTLALGITNISILVLLSFASLMREGSIAVFNFSFNLQSVPLTIVGVSYSLAAFPTLSGFFANRKMKEFVDHIMTSARHIIFWSLSFTVLFIVLRAHIVRIILGSGEFDWGDTKLTAACLAIFAISLMFQSLILLFVRGYYASSNTMKPLLVNIVGGVFIILGALFFANLFKQNSLFRFFLESLFRVENVSGTEVLALPLGYTFGLVINGIVIFLLFAKDFSKQIFELFTKTLFHVFSASVIMGFLTYISLEFFGIFFDINTFVGIFTQALLSAIIGISGFIIILLLMDNYEIKEIMSAFHRKAKGLKAMFVGSDPYISEM